MATSKVYRGRHEIIAQILQTVKESGSEGIPRTLIMYRAFLSYFQLREYLLVLEENGLIEKIGNSKGNGNGIGIEKTLYKITEKGMRYLHVSKEIESLMGITWEHKEATVQTNTISKL